MSKRIFFFAGKEKPAEIAQYHACTMYIADYVLSAKKEKKNNIYLSLQSSISMSGKQKKNGNKKSQQHFLVRFLHQRIQLFVSMRVLFFHRLKLSICGSRVGYQCMSNNRKIRIIIIFHIILTINIQYNNLE